MLLIQAYDPCHAGIACLWKIELLRFDNQRFMVLRGTII